MFKKIAFPLAVALLSSHVTAAPITSWNFTLDGQWTNWNNPVSQADAQNGLGVYGDGTTLLWGEPVGAQSSSLFINNPNIAGSFNLVDDGSGFWTDTVAGSIITHNNFVIGADSIDLQNTMLDEMFSLSAAIPPPAFGPINSVFNILFQETLNSAPCEATSISVCDDIFVVVNPGELTQMFSFDGYTYELEVSALGLGPLSSGACALAGAGPNCVGLQTQENEANDVQFFITLSSTASAVPEPAILGLFGFSLLGLGVVRRRKTA